METVTMKLANIRIIEKALRNAREELKYLSKDERCEHDVNLCWCSVFRAIEDINDALAVIDQ